MVEKTEREGVLRPIASSKELSSDDLQILIVPDKDRLVVKSEFDVSLISTKTSRLVTKLFQGEDVLCVWLENDKVLGSR
jgi:hypothetical protein